MKLSRLLVLFSLLPMLAYAQSETGLLRFGSEGFSINAAGFGVQRPDKGGAPGQPIVMLSLPPTEHFAPNVNVLIQNFPDSINDYIAITKQELDAGGFKLISERTASANEWVLEYAGNLNGRSLHFYARAIKNADKVYLTTATATVDQWDQVAPKLRESVDSFQLINELQLKPGS